MEKKRDTKAQSDEKKCILCKCVAGISIAKWWCQQETSKKRSQPTIDYSDGNIHINRQVGKKCGIRNDDKYVHRERSATTEKNTKHRTHTYEICIHIHQIDVILIIYWNKCAIYHLVFCLCWKIDGIMNGSLWPNI